jgi:hypothetical protein
MRYAVLAVALVLVGCGADDGIQPMPDGGNVADGSVSDALPPGCTIDFFPFEPEANAVDPVRATLDAGNVVGVPTYTWTVEHDGAMLPFTVADIDNTAIDFIAADPGTYAVSVEISGASTECPFVTGYVNVLAVGANTFVYRLRTVPPPNAGAPAQEQLIQVNGGADATRDITLDPGIVASGTVRSGSAAGPVVAAYLKFMPISAPLAFTELFTGASGQYSTHLLGVTHDVLVIPSDSSLAPALLQWTPATTGLVVTAGTLVTGTVRSPSGVGLAGATVQLIANGVPSTLGMTAGNGSFTLRADYPANAQITVKVAPPPASGLPRLQAQAAFDLAQAMQIDYAASLATCDLAGTQVKRGGTAQPGAQVSVVGTLAGTAATDTAGVSANATGGVLVSTTADGSGVLPATLVPRSSALTAVTKLAFADFAIDALNTSTCTAAQIDAPALATASGTATSSASTPLGGVQIEATPRGALALAGAPPVTVTTSGDGTFALQLAAGARYDVRFSDPHARVARHDELDVTSAGVPATVMMPNAVQIDGRVSKAGSTQPLAGTAIQLLCAQCTGLDATRPLAESATDAVSDYRIAVPDPGTM